MDEIYNQFNFEVTEDKYDNEFINLYWGTEVMGSTLSFPKEKLNELIDKLDEFQRG